MSPVFFAFVDRQKAYDVIEAVTGFRMHPAWYRIGGLEHDLPQGWDRLVREFVDYLPARLDEYQKVALENSIVVSRTRGIAAYDPAQAMVWGTTGGGLRATGLGYDLRKARPSCGSLEERLVWTERVNTGRYRWSPYH